MTARGPICRALSSSGDQLELGDQLEFGDQLAALEFGDQLAAISWVRQRRSAFRRDRRG
jgi:hypothetical protein